MDNNTSTNNPKSNTAVNNLTGGVLGLYDFKIKAILKEAWRKTYNVKATYWKALILVILIAVAAIGVLYLLAVLANVIAILLHASQAALYEYARVVNIILLIVYTVITAPLAAGILMIGVKHCSGQGVQAKSIFTYYRYYHKLWVLPTVLLIIDLLNEMLQVHWSLHLFLSLLSLYVLVSYFMFPLLIVEKHLNVWSALETSRKAISYHWFKMFWFLIVLGLIILGSLLTLGILLIWTLPMVNNAIGILYREMFGVEAKPEKNLYQADAM